VIGVRLDIVRAVFGKELREMLRDRRSLAVMFGVPLVLYPLLAIGISSLTRSKIDKEKETPARVALVNSRWAPELFAEMHADGTGINVQVASDADAALAAGAADAVVEVPERAQARAIEGEPVEFTVRLDRSRSGADFIARKIDKVLDGYQRWVMEQRLKQYNAPPSVLEPLKWNTVNIAGGEKVFGRVLAQTLPLLLLITGMLGALFPALNATTTERELGTLETLLVTPAGRTELLLAKGALVLISGCLTAGLNMLSMSLVLLKSMSMLVQGDAQYSISPVALLLSYVASIPALIFFSAIVLIVGLVARNFREANSFATPTMLLPLGSMAVAIAEPAATPAILLTPVANTTVIIREVLTGRATFAAFALAFVSSCLYAAIVLSFAARVFRSEQLVNPAWEPVSLKGLRGKRNKGERRLPPVDAAMGLFVTSLLLQFYLSTMPPKNLAEHAVPPLIPLLLLTQLGLILAPTLAFAAVFRWNWRETFSLKRARISLIAGAVLLGIGLMPWANVIALFQSKIWHQEPSPTSKLTNELIADAISRWPVITVILVGSLAGICEELLFRGPILSALLRRTRPWVAIAITAFLFAGAHLDLFGMPIRFGLGMLLGWMVWRSRSIFPAMLLHGLYDATALAVVAYEHWSRRAAPAMESQSFTRNDAIMLAVGAILIAAAVGLIRSGLARPPLPADNAGSEEPSHDPGRRLSGETVAGPSDRPRA
jgi:sodium transport system permease protein